MARLEAFEGKCEKYLPLLSQSIKWRKHSKKIKYVEDNVKIYFRV